MGGAHFWELETVVPGSWRLQWVGLVPGGWRLPWVGLTPGDAWGLETTGEPLLYNN